MCLVQLHVCISECLLVACLVHFLLTGVLTLTTKMATLQALAIGLFYCMQWHLKHIGSNCPGMSRTVLEFLTLSCVLDAHIICPGSVGRTAMVMLGSIS